MRLLHLVLLHVMLRLHVMHAVIGAKLTVNILIVAVTTLVVVEMLILDVAVHQPGTHVSMRNSPPFVKKLCRLAIVLVMIHFAPETEASQNVCAPLQMRAFVSGRWGKT